MASCGTCNGSGKVTVTVNKQGKRSTERINCPTCRGSGKT
jgi:DnaJ-class molecular chaperone